MMMKKILAIATMAVGLFVGVAHAADAPTVSITEQKPTLWLVDEHKKPAPRVYVHGDCSWVPDVALQAGWQPKQIGKLIQIIQRESGCCPRRIGGSVVDKNCNFIRMSNWSHPSDSGLLQINGVHWKQDHPQYHGLVCKQMGVCEQEPLLNPLTNLEAGRLLFDVAGWSPWQVIR